MSLVLALCSALAYGCADFLGGLFSRRTAPWAVAFVALASGGVLLLGLAALVAGDPTGADLGWGALAGVGSGLGTAFLYRGFATGRMGVVAPISGVGSAVLPVLVGVLSGERPGTVVQLGLVLALPGIWLVSSEPRDPAARAAGRRRRVPPGVGDGVLAGLGFGTLFAALGQVPEEAGLLPLALHQVIATAVVAVAGLLLRQAWWPRERAAVLGGLVPGVLGATATGTYLVAAQGGLLSVTAVLASLYPAVTVLLALTLLRERAHAAQVWGLALCGVAVALVAGG